MNGERHILKQNAVNCHSTFRLYIVRKKDLRGVIHFGEEKHIEMSKTAAGLARSESPQNADFISANSSASP